MGEGRAAASIEAAAADFAEAATDVEAAGVVRASPSSLKINRGTTSNALTAARNSGLNVSLEVEGNSLRRSRSRLTLVAPSAGPGLADVYAMLESERKECAAADKLGWIFW